MLLIEPMINEKNIMPTNSVIMTNKYSYIVLPLISPYPTVARVVATK